MTDTMEQGRGAEQGPGCAEEGLEQAGLWMLDFTEGGC